MTLSWSTALVRGAFRVVAPVRASPPRCTRRLLATGSFPRPRRIPAAALAVPLVAGAALLVGQDPERREWLLRVSGLAAELPEQLDPEWAEWSVTQQQLKARYSFSRQLGAGASGEVWLAVDSASGRCAHARQRLEAERAAIDGPSHP
jgi:hypothetical protein